MNTPNSQQAGNIYDRLHWSQTEKAIARKAFDRALHAELAEVIQHVKDAAGKIKEPHQIWELETYLTRRRRQIDEKYDYRYSILILVFVWLLREGRLQLEDFEGLGEEKLDLLRGILAL